MRVCPCLYLDNKQASLASTYDYFVGRSVGWSVATLHEPGITRFVRTGTFRTRYLVVYSTACPSLPLPRSI